MKRKVLSVFMAFIMVLSLMILDTKVSAAAESMFAAKTGSTIYESITYELGTIFRSSVEGEITGVKEKIA